MRTYIRASRGRSILGINIFENTPTIFVDLFDGITVRQAVVKHVANQVIDGGFGFLLIDPMIQFVNPRFYLLKQLDGNLFDPFDVLRGQVALEKQIIDG